MEILYNLQLFNKHHCSVFILSAGLFFLTLCCLHSGIKSRGGEFSNPVWICVVREVFSLGAEQTTPPPSSEAECCLGAQDVEQCL